MSLTTAPPFNLYIDRIVEMIENSPLLFPQSVGGDPNATDLIKQVIKHQIPIPENPPSGPDPPHIYVTLSRNPIVSRLRVGRDSRNAQGPANLKLEFYIIILTRATTLQESEKQMLDIITALTTMLDKNKRMLDKTGANPIANTSEYFLLDFLLDTDQREQLAKNVLFRPSVFVNLSEP